MMIDKKASRVTNLTMVVLLKTELITHTFSTFLRHNILSLCHTIKIYV